MPSDPHQQEMLAVLREIRDQQRAMLEQVSAQRALIEEQVKRSRESIAESISLQKLAMDRQRAITLFAMVGIVGCIVAILYLVLRYF
jgi:formate dehydrogenase maturation protein FdhE